ncbi:hypothetical protein RHSIM_Rhsim09G0081400 [Rhododendron simsii]|uniref:Uncharacterized protein n=1 Tax=Rhododendron simsii TaxID=118357 RepID=A0A834GJL7_RHOSS|nr:hypothetical protein RHSIM_Rhsim09G0081400 [Rhododendron simsii]
MEEESENFSEAAEIAKTRGDILLEADLLRKAGCFNEACMLILKYVFATSMWVSRSKGWPLKHFPEANETFEKAKSFAKNESELFYKFVCCEASILSNEETNLFSLNQYLNASHGNKSLTGEILSTRRILDVHLHLSALKYEWEDGLAADLSEHCEQSVNNISYVILNSDAYWVKDITDRFLQRSGKLVSSDARHFVSAPRSHWRWELLYVGLKVLETLEALHKLSVAKFLLGSKYLDCKYYDAQTLHNFLNLSTGYLDFKGKLTSGLIGRVVMIWLGSRKPTEEIYKKILKRFDENPLWREVINDLSGNTESESSRESTSGNLTEAPRELLGRNDIMLQLPREFYDVFRKARKRVDVNIIAESFMKIGNPLLTVRLGENCSKFISPNGPHAIFVDLRVTHRKEDIMEVLFPMDTKAPPGHPVSVMMDTTNSCGKELPLSNENQEKTPEALFSESATLADKKMNRQGNVNNFVSSISKIKVEVEKIINLISVALTKSGGKLFLNEDGFPVLKPIEGCNTPVTPADMFSVMLDEFEQLSYALNVRSLKRLPGSRSLSAEDGEWSECVTSRPGCGGQLLRVVECSSEVVTGRLGLKDLLISSDSELKENATVITSFLRNFHLRRPKRETMLNQLRMPNDTNADNEASETSKSDENKGNHKGEETSTADKAKALDATVVSGIQNSGNSRDTETNKGKGNNKSKKKNKGKGGRKKEKK